MLKSMNDKHVEEETSVPAYSIPAQTTPSQIQRPRTPAPSVYKRWKRGHQMEFEGCIGVGGYLIPSGAIPPRIIKSSICESGDFRKHIQNTLENNIKSQ